MSYVQAIAFPAVSRRRFLAFSAGAAMAVIPAGRALAVAPKAVTTATGGFLDASIVHDIAVTFDQGAYDAMVATYEESGDKEWIEATVTIDGSTYQQAGMRLKGNSSLGGRMRIIGPDGEEVTPPAGDDLATPIAGEEQTDEPGFVDRPDGGTDFDAPEGLPWLIRLDKFVDGQRHQGFKELVIRSNPTQTSLNEAVALDVIAAAGLASQLAAATGFSVNDSDPVLRLAVELPNDDWMALRFSPDGLLYKGEATGDYSYRGEDPEEYDEVFDLEAGGSGDDAADMKPLIEFLDFLNNSDDATFAGEIAQRLDVPQFAVYLATMELIGNFDDLAGPGNNGYLYRDSASGQFTVVPWDMNLAFGGPGDIKGGPATGGEPPKLDGEPVTITEGSGLGTPVAEGGASGNGPTFQTSEPGEGPTVHFGGPGGENRLSNPLVERFRGIAAYATLIEEETSRLRADLYASGVADGMLSRWTGLLELGASAMVDQATIASEAETIAAFFTAS